MISNSKNSNIGFKTVLATQYGALSPPPPPPPHTHTSHLHEKTGLNTMYIDPKKIFPSREINVSLPGSTLKNGSLYVHMFLGLKGNSPHYHSNRQRMAAVTSPVTRYAIPESTTFSLLMGEYEVGLVMHYIIH